MDPSPLDRLKHFILSTVGLAPEALLVLLGLVCYLATCLIARQPLTWAWALVPGLCVSVALEAAEVWNHYGAEGLAKATPADLLGIGLRHARDVLVTNLAPVLVFLTALLLAGAPDD